MRGVTLNLRWLLNVSGGHAKTKRLSGQSKITHRMTTGFPRFSTNISYRLRWQPTTTANLPPVGARGTQSEPLILTVQPWISCSFCHPGPTVLTGGIFTQIKKLSETPLLQVPARQHTTYASENASGLFYLRIGSLSDSPNVLLFVNDRGALSDHGG